MDVGEEERPGHRLAADRKGELDGLLVLAAPYAHGFATASLLSVRSATASWSVRLVVAVPAVPPTTPPTTCPAQQRQTPSIRMPTQCPIANCGCDVGGAVLAKASN